MEQRRTGYQKNITDEEIQLLDIHFSKQIPQIQCAYLFMRYMGMRISDATTVKIENIQNGHIIKEMIKTKKILNVPIPIKLMTWILKYIDIHKNGIIENSNFLAYTNRGKGHIKAGSIRAIFTTFRRQNGKDVPYYTQKSC